MPKQEIHIPPQARTKHAGQTTTGATWLDLPTLPSPSYDKENGVMALFTPTPGITRLEALEFAPEALARDLTTLTDEPWLHRGPWSHLILLSHQRDGVKRHRQLDHCPAILAVLGHLPSRVVTVQLARLPAGAYYSRHRDLTGLPTGIVRFHVPIVTHPDVDFVFDKIRVHMPAGSCWALDTTYFHWGHNRSPVSRVHLIIDVELNDRLRAVLPPSDWRTQLHRLRFAMYCAARVAELSLSPNDRGRLRTRVEDFFRLTVLRQSVPG